MGQRWNHLMELRYNLVASTDFEWWHQSVKWTDNFPRLYCLPPLAIIDSEYEKKTQNRPGLTASERCAKYAHNNQIRTPHF